MSPSESLEAPLRIVFAGTPDFAVPALESLVNAGLKPLAVLTQPDRAAGRGRKIMPGPVKRAALAADIPVHQPVTLQDPAEQRWLSNLEPDLLIVVAYGLILPVAVLAIPRFGCWNIHASLLPRWRGAAPVQRAIEAGDQSSGVCIMQMDAGLDTGPVLRCAEIPLEAQETGATLHDRLAASGAVELLRCIHELASGRPPAATPQPDTGITYAAKLHKDEARLDWSLGADVLERKIRAFNPWPVAWCNVRDERTRIWSSCVVDCTSPRQEPASTRPGEILATGDKGIDVATGNGVLRLLELQRPGGRRVPAEAYLRAHSLPQVLS